MSDLALQAAGLLAIVVAGAHGYLGQTQVIGPAAIARPMTRHLLQAVWQAGAMHWALGGIAFIVAPYVMGAEARLWLVIAMAAAYAPAALGNLWVLRGRHPGGWLLGFVVVLAVVGVL